MKLVVGLGNPGGEYAATRHNAGAWWVARLAEQLRVGVGWVERSATHHVLENGAAMGCISFGPSCLVYGSHDQESAFLTIRAAFPGNLR